MRPWAPSPAPYKARRGDTLWSLGRMIAKAVMLSHCGWQLGGGKEGDGHRDGGRGGSRLRESFGVNALLLFPAPAVSGCRPSRLPAHLPLLPGITAEALLQELRRARVGRPSHHAHRLRPASQCSSASVCPWSFRSCLSRGSCARLGRGLRDVLGLGTHPLHQDTIKKGLPVLSE